MRADLSRRIEKKTTNQHARIPHAKLGHASMVTAKGVFVTVTLGIYE